MKESKDKHYDLEMLKQSNRVTFWISIASAIIGTIALSLRLLLLFL